MYTTRVRRGAAWLDEVQPGWYTRVTRPISMMDPYSCVAGQVFARFGISPSGFPRSGYGYVCGQYGTQFASAHGFSGGTWAAPWYRQISKRQKRAAKARKRAQAKHDLAA